MVWGWGSARVGQGCGEGVSFSQIWNRAASDQDSCWAEIVGIASYSNVSEEVLQFYSGSVALLSQKVAEEMASPLETSSMTLIKEGLSLRSAAVEYHPEDLFVK